MDLLLDTHALLWFYGGIAYWVAPYTTPGDIALSSQRPFDRIIIAQALAEQVPIVTKDLIFSDYGINRQW